MAGANGVMRWGSPDSTESMQSSHGATGLDLTGMFMRGRTGSAKTLYVNVDCIVSNRVVSKRE
jgi:hypothetical protein